MKVTREMRIGRLRNELADIAANLGTLARAPEPLDHARVGDLMQRRALAYGECEALTRPRPF